MGIRNRAPKSAAAGFSRRRVTPQGARQSHSGIQKIRLNQSHEERQRYLGSQLLPQSSTLSPGPGAWRSWVPCHRSPRSLHVSCLPSSLLCCLEKKTSELAVCGLRVPAGSAPFVSPPLSTGHAGALGPSTSISEDPWMQFLMGVVVFLELAALSVQGRKLQVSAAPA